MTSRSRGYGGNDWDTREDYNSNHEMSQYTDDENVFDHTRLYVTNLAKGLSEQGLKEVFAKYGTLEEAHVSKDPKKRYALFKYETAGEAKIAMVKLNKTEPLFLNISIAKKSKAPNNQDRQSRTNVNGYNERNDRPRRDRDDSASVSSRGRRSRAPDEQTNGGDSVKEKVEDELGLDRNLHMELESLKLEQLEIKKEQLKIKEEELVCKHRLLLLQQSDKKGGTSSAQTSGSNRCILPDGRIVVRATEKYQDNDASFTAGAGDSYKCTQQLTIPGLQRYGGRECIVCGARADSYCAGCGVTPYCSERCQRRDWAERHRAVCHNLARLDKGESKSRPETVVPEPEPVVAPAAPLRRPNTFKRDMTQDEDRPKTTKFIPPGEKAQAIQAMAQKKPSSALPRTNRSNNYNNNKQETRRPQNDIFAGDDSWENKGQAPQKASSVKSQSHEPSQSPTKVDNNMKPADILSLMKPKRMVQEDKPKEVPVKPLIKMEPPKYLVENLPIGEAFLASVEAPASECATKQPGYVCLTMHGDYEEIYNKLCIDYVSDCEKEAGNVTPSPGVVVSYRSAADGGWYRARCLSRTRAALLDAGKLTPLTADQCKTMIQQYIQYPEFCAVIQAKGIKTGANLKCTIKSKTESGFKVSVVDAETGADYGDGDVSRWIPEVEMPTAATIPSSVSSIPSVPRPPLKDGERVILLDVTTLKRAALRPRSSTADFDNILHTVLLCGMKASPLKEPPVPGQVVIAKFTDDVHYRALVKRTKAAQHRYLIEYIEYGNEEVITSLERLYPCPDEFNLTNMPAIASVVSLSDIETPALTPPAETYIEKLKDTEELILTIPSGEKTVPSGSLVNLTLAKNNESVNKKLEQMCTPDWKKLEERGGDVLETKALMYGDLKNAELPLDREFTLEIVDFDTLVYGSVIGYMKGDPLADAIYGPLTEKMNKYCESDLCKEPYLPRQEELCITKYPPYPQWFRAVLIDLVQGAGSGEARVLYIDYGNLGTVPVTDLRKMLPEFIDGYPALANQIDIANFPEKPTEAQLRLAIEMMNVNKEGRGSLQVSKCEVDGQGGYKIEVPSFVAALKSLQ